jgi:hypothetical protein
MPPKIESTMRVAARASAVLIAACYAAFAIGETTRPFQALTLQEGAGMVLLFAAIVAMLFAWTWELPGALISLAALASFGLVVHMRRLDVLAIAAIPNILFLIDWKLRRSHAAPISKPA